MTTVYQPVTQDIAGMIMKVKELVDVKEVEEKLEKSDLKELRRPYPGFYVERRVRDKARLDELGLL